MQARQEIHYLSADRCLAISRKTRPHHTYFGNESIIMIYNVIEPKVIPQKRQRKNTYTIVSASSIRCRKENSRDSCFTLYSLS